MKVNSLVFFISFIYVLLCQSDSRLMLHAYQPVLQEKETVELFTVSSTEEHKNSGQLSLFQFSGNIVFWTITSFIVLLLFLKKFAWKPLIQLLDQKQKEMEDSISAIKNQEIKAQKLLEKAKTEYDTVKREALKIIENSKKEGEELKKDLETQARETYQRIVKEGERSIQEEKNKAIQNIKSVVVQISGKMVEILTDKQFKDQDHSRFIEKYVDDLIKK